MKIKIMKVKWILKVCQLTRWHQASGKDKAFNFIKEILNKNNKVLIKNRRNK